MTIYKILDSDIKVSSGIENSQYIAKIFNPHVSSCKEIIKKWYKQQGDCDSVLDKLSDLQYYIVCDFLDEAFDILNANQIYTIDKDSLALRFFENCFAKLEKVAELMEYNLCEIQDDKESAAEYRRMRKANRDRWQGGGFGLSGAISGAAKAGALNAVSGVGHSIRNAAGNFASSVGASIKTGQLYSEYETYFIVSAEETIRCVKAEMREILQSEKNLSFEFQSEEDNKKGDSIFNNYLNGSIPSSNEKKMIVTALSLNYYNARIYETIWLNYGDNTGDLVKMANAFGIPLTQYINACVEEYGKKAYQNYCLNFMNSRNKINASLKYEQDIKNATNNIRAFCKDHNVPYNQSATLKTLNEYLNIADRLKKTVEGVTYTSVSEANNIRHDIQVFDKILDEKSIFDDNAFDEICKGQYLSQMFVSELRKRYVCEKILRNPYDILETLFALTVKGNKNKNTSSIFGIPGKCGNLSETQTTIEEICLLKPNETILAVIDRSIGIFNNKGKGKSGILFTNLNLRIFSKQLLAKENESFALNEIQNIEALGDNEYLLSTTDGEIYRFQISLGDFSIEEQNFLAELILRSVNLIRHIYDQQRIQLKNILNPDAIRCLCGKYILKSDKICSACHRFVDSDGNFTESIECPNCGSYVKVHSKYCTKCGHEMMSAHSDEYKDDNVGESGFEERIEATSVVANVVSCPSCLKENPFGKKFCKYCGASIASLNTTESINNTITAESVALCPNCGNEIKLGKAFCGKCGSKI